MKFINKIIVVCLCASVFAGGCGQSGQDTTKSKKSESTGSSKKNTEQASSDTEASKDIFAMDKKHRMRWMPLKQRLKD